MPPELMKKIAHYVELSAINQDDITAKLAEQQQKQAATRAKAEEVVDRMIRHSFLKASARTKAIEQLSDPITALEYLAKQALSSSPTSGEVPGQLGSTMVSGAAPAATNGRRQTGPRQRDIDYVTSLGLPPEFANMHS